MMYKIQQFDLEDAMEMAKQDLDLIRHKGDVLAISCLKKNYRTKCKRNICKNERMSSRLGNLRLKKGEEKHVNGPCKGKGLLGPNGGSGGKFEGGFWGKVGSCGDNVKRKVSCRNGWEDQITYHLSAEGGAFKQKVYSENWDDGPRRGFKSLKQRIGADGELPTGVLNSLTPEHVIHCNTENECTQLAKSLPPTEAALLDWAINLMADVSSNPLTALIHAVQIMNLLKTLIMKTLCEREESSSGFEPLSSCANNRSPNNKVEHPYLLKNATLKRLGSENEEQFWSFPRQRPAHSRILIT
ncbi:hypothetical protein Tco_0684645 [Tanacetum coccineum]